jgi:uncharacterized membrane protein YhaH (DUF805 family)
MIEHACPHCGEAITVPEVNPFLELAAAQRADPFMAIHAPQRTSRPSPQPKRRGAMFLPIAACAGILLVLVFLAAAICYARNHDEKTLDIFAWVAAVLAFIAIGMIPGAIASSRGHHNAEAIGMLGFFGLAVGILWIGAIVWALTVPNPSEDRR